jgi:pimeloyl-ACP methyl ester carboxylesterase
MQFERAALDAGYAGSGPLTPPLTFTHEAQALRALLRHLGLDRVHVVGHSLSACIVLQMALDAPEWVHSIALLEPPLMAVPSPPEVPRALELYRAGDTAGAVDTFLRGTCGADWRDRLEAALPGRTSSRSSSQAQGTCCTSRTRAGWPTAWPASSRAIRSAP